MRAISRQLILVLLALTVAACGDVPRIDVSPTPPTTVKERAVRQTRTSAVDFAEVQRVAANVKAVRDYKLVTDTELVHHAAALIAQSHKPTIPIGTPISTSSGTWAATGGGAPCDGDLPPCWRIYGTESGGRWDAYNPGGCSGTGCFGPYQFGGFWAGKLGLPNDLRATTKEQWINAARQLWNHGAGCGNWSAC